MQKYLFFFNNRFIFFTELLTDTFAKQVENNQIIDLQNTSIIDFEQFFLSKEENNLILKFSDNKRKDFRMFLQHFDVVKAAGGIVRNPSGEILLIYRNNVWDLPKGKAEKGENMLQVALREVEEECGIENLQIENFVEKTFHIYQLGSKMILKKTYWYNMFISNFQEAIPQFEESITKAEWKDAAELKECLKNTYPNIRLVLKFKM